MSKILLASICEGDVLLKDVKNGDVALFAAGTVVIKKIIDIMTILKIQEVEIENREGSLFRNVKELFEHIDKRFDYCQESELMTKLKYVVKDIAAQQRGYR